jgi:hypothetical protein
LNDGTKAIKFSAAYPQSHEQEISAVQQRLAAHEFTGPPGHRTLGKTLAHSGARTDDECSAPKNALPATHDAAVLMGFTPPDLTASHFRLSDSAAVLPDGRHGTLHVKISRNYCRCCRIRLAGSITQKKGCSREDPRASER